MVMEARVPLETSDAPSASSALERLTSAGQDMIVKRLDLALLEAEELLSHTLRDAALGALATILAAAAWFALAACVTRLLTEDAGVVVRLAIFGLLNAGGAAGLFTLAMRRGRHPAPVRPDRSVTRAFAGENGRGAH